jgi:hypothetical protein
VRYVTASGPLCWLYLLRDKATDESRGEYFAPDHCCFGYDTTTDEMPHPFLSFDSNIHNLYILHPTKKEVKAAKLLKRDDRNLSIIDAFWQLYDVDTSNEEEWPDDVEVSTGVDEDLDTGKKTIVKEKTVKPQHAKYYKFKDKEE